MLAMALSCSPKSMHINTFSLGAGSSERIMVMGEVWDLIILIDVAEKIIESNQTWNGLKWAVSLLRSEGLSCRLEKECRNWCFSLLPPFIFPLLPFLPPLLPLQLCQPISSISALFCSLSSKYFSTRLFIAFSFYCFFPLTLLWCLFSALLKISW